MNDSSPLTSAVPPADSPRVAVTGAIPRAFWGALALLLAGFAWPLVELARFAAGSDLFSYIALLPLVSLHAIWLRRAAFRADDAPWPRPAALAFLGAGALLALWRIAPGAARPFAGPADALAVSTGAFVLMLVGTCLWFLGRTAMRALAFPLVLIGLMTPIPSAAIHWIETVMQHGSAAVAHGLFELSGTSVFYSHLVFQLPGITLQVAPECSGIRSTLALFIVSVIAGCVFLRRPGHRGLVILAVVPLALLRNGFRIFVIGELCTHYGPQMIDSLIHRRGGPLFFALSLVPFLLLLVFLQRREQRGAPAA